MRRLFFLCLEFECIIEYNWISTRLNVYADALSHQGGHACFLEHVARGELLPPGVVLRMDRRSGTFRRLLLGPAFSSDAIEDGPPQGRRDLQATVPHSRASVWVGLPSTSVADSLERILDHRLAGSSLRSVSAALGHWDVVVARHGWPRVIVSDYPTRGGKLVAFVVYLVDETELAAQSISNYVWALRVWLKFQRQLDPVFGIPE